MDVDHGVAWVDRNRPNGNAIGGRMNKTNQEFNAAFRNKLYKAPASDVLELLKQAGSKKDLLLITAVAVDWILTKMIEKGD